MITSKQCSNHWRIVLRPNRSASWAQSKIFIGVLAVPVLAIALAWSLVGGWIILPFAGLEISLLAFLMFKVNHQTYLEQIIVINRDIVSIETGFRQKNKRCLSRNTCYVLYSETENDWQLPVIRIISDEVEITVGQFLNLTDRQLLKNELQRAGLIICRPHWWRD
ncbi:DUF2244 domain-containing protein [Alteromonas sp. ASW11-130]|uniref:DUF2244 domain-containing protein n=1 Tax=Alteromonas sp. ASW11-130 TaxID=3015775 RepID=UPI002241D8F3|nr:DUF2244 domain-containing protein [Alteromonas sp. ASW11-130]MCW8092538.1 DUF2244 domain-containing protein [Alteromonas sp. ASW11-130]